MEDAKKEVLRRLPAIGYEGDSVDTMINMAWRTVREYGYELGRMKAGNRKADMIRMFRLNGQITEDASVEEVLKMAGNRVDDYDRTVARFSGHVREKRIEGYSSSGWDQNRMLADQLRNMQKGLKKLEELRPEALLATAMAGDPTGLDLLKAIRDGKNQGAWVQLIEKMVNEHFDKGNSILKPEVRAWAEWSTTKLNDEMENAEANAHKKQKQKGRKAKKHMLATSGQEGDGVELSQ